MKIVEDFLNFILGTIISQFRVRTSEICPPQDRPTDGSAQRAYCPLTRPGSLSKAKTDPARATGQRAVPWLSGHPARVYFNSKFETRPGSNSSSPKIPLNSPKLDF